MLRRGPGSIVAFLYVCKGDKFVNQIMNRVSQLPHKSSYGLLARQVIRFIRLQQPLKMQSKNL